MAIGKREHDLFADMVRTTAWAEFQRIAEQKVIEKLHKLRNVRKGGPGGYDRTTGLLDGMELIKDLVGNELDEFKRSQESDDSSGETDKNSTEEK